MTHARIEAEDLLDRYLLRKLSPLLEAELEDHLLWCRRCQEELSRAREAIDHVKRACELRNAPVVQASRPRTLALPLPAWGLAAGLVIAAVLVGVRRPAMLEHKANVQPEAPALEKPAPVVRLESYRSGVLPSAPAAAKLFVLQLDLRGLAKHPSYAVEIVKESGVALFEQSGLIAAGDDALEVRVSHGPFAAGDYWVRVHGVNQSGTRQLLREYGLGIR